MRSQGRGAAVQVVEGAAPVGPVVREVQAVSSANSFLSSTKTETNA